MLAIRHYRSALVGMLSVALALTPPAAALADPPSYTAFTIDGSGSSALMPAGVSHSLDTAQIALTTTGTGLTMTGSSATAGAWSATVTPPTGTELVAGSFPTLATANSTHAGLNMTGHSVTCTTAVAGTLHIEQIDRDPSTSAITAFAATYSTTCNGPDAIHGELRWQSSVGFVAAQQSASSVDFGTGQVGGSFPTQKLYVTATGSDPTVFGTAALTGTNAGSFSITADTCSGNSVDSGQLCSITVEAVPVAAGASTATLTLPDNTALGHRIAGLTASAGANAAGSYFPVTPARLLDTRTTQTPIGAQSTISIPVLGRYGVPTHGVSAVVVNVTETGPTHDSFITVYPDGASRPTASNLNFLAGRAVANQVTVQVGTNGAIRVYNDAGSTQLIVDIAGLYVSDNTLSTGGHLHPMAPSRALDTRDSKPVPARGKIVVPIAESATIHAVVVNVTAVGPAKVGYLTTWSGAGSQPSTSTVNFAPGTNVANLAIVPVSSCTGSGCKPSIAIYNGSDGTVDVLVDVVGYFDDGVSAGGLRFHPVTTTRIVDSRYHLGIPTSLGAASTATVTNTVGGASVAALALNVTAVTPSAKTFLIVWPSDLPQPDVSSLNPYPGVTVANAAIIGVSSTDTFKVYNDVGSIGLLIDVAGYYS